MTAMALIDLEKVYADACAGCTKHGDAPGECYSDEPCGRLIFALTTAEPVDAVKVVRCRDCILSRHPQSTALVGEFVQCAMYDPMPLMRCSDFCSYGTRVEEK